MINVIANMSLMVLAIGRNVMAGRLPKPSVLKLNETLNNKNLDSHVKSAYKAMITFIGALPKPIKEKFNENDRPQKNYQ